MSTRLLSISAALALLASCGGGGDGGSTPPPPDLSGVWSGAWQGTDPSAGNILVSGTWAVTITQGQSSASGPGTLLGEIDCMDGQMQTNPGAQTAVTGFLTRPGCAGQVNWTLTALNIANGAAAGTWTNTNTGGSGSMTGTRIAQLTGPRIRFVSPPGGTPDPGGLLPGAIVTIVGENLSVSGPGGILFGTASPPVLISQSATRIVAAVPQGATTGAIRIGTANGSASSPFSFDTNVSAPPLQAGNNATLTFVFPDLRFAPGAVAPSALAVSPDGRKFYVADRGNATVKLVRASTLLLMQSVDVGAGPRSVVASPDGKRVYVATNAGVRVLDAANLNVYHTAFFAIDDGGRDNPQGLAISPDGRTLLVSDGTVVLVYSIAGDTLVAVGSFTPGATHLPVGVAFSPDGARAYVAAADTNAGVAGALYVFDPANPSAPALDAEAVGILPTAIAVSPDGKLVFVTNKGSNTVSVYDSSPGVTTITATVSVGAQPTGIAVAPNGLQAFVANQGANAISVIGTGAGFPVTAPAGFTNLNAPIAIAINSRGTTAYIAQLAPAGVRQIGGLHMLTVVLAGNGIGSVRSNDSRINCGTACQAEYASSETITLTAIPTGSSSFNGWSGACSGFGTVISFNLAATGTCTANFIANSPPPSQQNQNPNNCFIATAAYGSEMAHEVQVLRELRDWISNYAAGRAIVSFYYRNSPPIAERIRESAGARAAVRGVLTPVLWTVAHPAYAALFAFSCGLLGWSVRARRSARSRPGL